MHAHALQMSREQVAAKNLKKMRSIVTLSLRYTRMLTFQNDWPCSREQVAAQRGAGGAELEEAFKAVSLNGGGPSEWGEQAQILILKKCSLQCLDIVDIQEH